jgi:hypothetical protein
MPSHPPSRSLFRHRALLSGCVVLGALSNACGSDAPNSSSAGGAPSGGNSAQGGSSIAGSAQTGGGGAQGGVASGAGGAALAGAGQGGAAGGSGGAGQAGSSAGSTGNVRGYYSSNPAEFAGAPRCAGLDVQICEDFESGTFDPGTWTLHQSSAGDTPTIDALHVMRGTKAAHFHTSNNEFSYISETKTFPEMNDTFWGRMFFYVDALPVTPTGAHFTILEGAGTGDTSKVREGGQYRKFGVGTDGGPTGDWTNIDQDPTKDTAQEIPEKTFICVEWQYKGETNETHFYADGVEHPSLATSPSVMHGANSAVQYLLPQFNSLWMGWWLYQAGPMPDHYDVWIDEIAIDKARIGCSL